MSDNVTSLFPNILQPVVALKVYAPLGVRYWENQQTALEALREFNDGWFARRRKGAQAALETAQRMGDAATHFDMLREYQSWFASAMELYAEEGKACQQQLLRAGAFSGTASRKRSEPTSVRPVDRSVVKRPSTSSQGPSSARQRAVVWTTRVSL
jgi:hypothetical protein